MKVFLPNKEAIEEKRRCMRKHIRTTFMIVTFVCLLLSIFIYFVFSFELSIITLVGFGLFIYAYLFVQAEKTNELLLDMHKLIIITNNNIYILNQIEKCIHPQTACVTYRNVGVNHFFTLPNIYVQNELFNDSAIDLNSCWCVQPIKIVEHTSDKLIIEIKKSNHSTSTSFLSIINVYPNFTEIVKGISNIIAAANSY